MERRLLNQTEAEDIIEHLQNIAWIEKGDKYYFLTRKEVDSPKGEALKLRFPGSGELIGHSEIRAYYEFDDGVDRECTDFSTPDNFPEPIVKAIKEGEFRGFAIPEGLLNQPARV